MRAFLVLGSMVTGVVTLAFSILFFGVLFAFPLKWTWNYVIPFLFGLKEITVYQAWCLAFVAGVLVKNNKA